MVQQPNVQGGGTGAYQVNGSGLAVPARSPSPQPPEYNAQAVSALVQMGFTVPAAEVINDRLIVCVNGWEKTGKTHFSLTAPDPIVYFSVDIGTEGVVEKFVRAGKRILLYEVRYRRNQASQDYTALWQRLQRGFSTALQIGSGTIVFDTWTECYELCRLHHFSGKLEQQRPQTYAQVYADLRSMVRDAYDSGMNVVFLNKMGWKFQMAGDSGPPQMEVKGFSDMAYLVQANLMTFRTQEPMQPGQWKPPAPEFGVTVMDCRQNPLITGAVLTGERANWGYLQWLVHRYQGEGG